MSVLSEKIRVALYGKLNVANVTNLATGGVFYGEAKLSSNYPLLIFEKASNLPSYTFGFTLSHEESLWMLKAFVDRDASTSKSPIDLGEDILSFAVTEIGQSLSLSSGSCLGVMRMGDLPEIRQPLSDRNIWMTGVMLRIWSTDEVGLTPPPDIPSYARARVIDEIPNGAINGANATFTTANNFLPESVEVTLNGISQRKGAGFDYITVGNDTIIFTVSPDVGDTILVDYEVQ